LGDIIGDTIVVIKSTMKQPQFRNDESEKSGQTAGVDQREPPEVAETPND
jgi:hypothetical protein